MRTQITAVIAAERDRAVGGLTAAEVRAAVARFLAPHEVAHLAHAALTGRAPRSVLDELRLTYRGYAGGGVICTANATGLAVEIGDRGGLVPWRLLAQVVADGTTPDRLAALDVALTDDRRRDASTAAEAIVQAGPSATQLDLLDQLPELPTEKPTPAPRAKRTRKTATTTTTTGKGVAL